MKTFVDIQAAAGGMPTALVTELGRVDFGRGREELHLGQAPQLLERLAAQTRFESIIASNAIENVVVEADRALDLIGQSEPIFRDRTEREFAGYRDAIDYLMNKEAEPLSVPLILHTHRQLVRHIDDPLAGKFKEEDNLIGDRSADGSVTVVFEPVRAGRDTERSMQELVERYEDAVSSGAAHALVLIAALVLDLLAIHPFRDGNGRVARLITTNELLRHGYGIARYVSVEQRIYASRNSYYDALRSSQVGWHEGRHDLWPWAGYLLRLLADANDDFERRVVGQRSLRGATKEDQARDYILNHAPREFRSAAIVAALPDISPATVRNALIGLRDEGLVTSTRGRSAMWRRVDPPSSAAPA